MARTLIILTIVFSTGLATDAEAEITAKEVRAAIQKGIRFLKNNQKPDGSWEEMTGLNAGVSSLCTLALLNSGLDEDDPAVRKAVNWLRKTPPDRTYAVALQTMVFCKANPKRDLPLIRRNAEWLEKTQNQSVRDNPRGAWGYPGGGDNSNTQFALLGLHAAELAGIPVEQQTWNLAKLHWEDCQRADGGWGYKKGNRATGSMTCAGIASMIITSGAVRKPGASVVDTRIICCGGDRGPDEARIDRGIQWLARNFSVARNPSSGDIWALYYLYGIERVGRLSARRFIGSHDWYREGADHLVTSLGTGDYWQGTGIEDNRLIATSLAILFLSKGRRPILISKVAQGHEANWNLHAGDVAHLTRFVESEWKTDMTWQVVDLATASADDLAQSPVVYLLGERTPLLGDAAQRETLARKIRGYLDRGGFLLAEAYCQDKGFDKGFRELMAMAFPEPEYRLRLLPPEHPIWRAEKPIPPRYVRPLWGIDYGCRTSVVYAPREGKDLSRPSLSCLWELAYPPRGKTYLKSVQSRVDAGLWTGLNILAYATNRELQGKETTFDRNQSNTLTVDSSRGRLDIANLRHAGGCRAAPRALLNLLEAAEEELGMPADRRRRWISAADDVLFDYHMAFMQGRSAFQFTPAERERLRTFLERGGLLYANAICANEAFTNSFRREMAKVLPGHPMEPIPAEDPIWTEEYGGFDLKKVRRRVPRAGTDNEPLKADIREGPPLLQGIKLGDHWAVIFSDVDISCALEKHDSMECKGYLREDAARISLNVILYSLQF